MFSLVNNEYFSEEIVKEKVSDVMLDNIDLQMGNIIYENNNRKNLFILNVFFQKLVIFE